MIASPARKTRKGAMVLASLLGLALVAGCATMDTSDDTGTGRDGATGGTGSGSGTGSCTAATTAAPVRVSTTSPQATRPSTDHRARRLIGPPPVDVAPATPARP